MSSLKNISNSYLPDNNFFGSGGVDAYDIESGGHTRRIDDNLITIGIPMAYRAPEGIHKRHFEPVGTRE